MNAAYLKVTHGLCFHLYLFNNFVFILFFSWLRIADVHQLWSFAFSRKHEERAVADAGMVHVTFFFFLSNWDGAPLEVGALRKLRYWSYMQYIVCSQTKKQIT